LIESAEIELFGIWKGYCRDRLYYGSQL